MNVLGELRSRRNLALIVITHDISLAIRHTSTVLVLEEGRVVHTGATSNVLGTSRPPSMARPSSR